MQRTKMLPLQVRGLMILSSMLFSIHGLAGHLNKDFCVMACFSTVNGKWVISGSEDNHLYVWDLNTCQVVGKLTGHTRPVLSCDVHPSEQVIVSGSLDKNIKIWRSMVFGYVVSQAAQARKWASLHIQRGGWGEGGGRVGKLSLELSRCCYHHRLFQLSFPRRYKTLVRFLGTKVESSERAENWNKAIVFKAAWHSRFSDWKLVWRWILLVTWRRAKLWCFALKFSSAN